MEKMKVKFYNEKTDTRQIFVLYLYLVVVLQGNKERLLADVRDEMKNRLDRQKDCSRLH